jgi:hypothetical protein
MESHSLPGRVNISESTYELVRDHFNCKYRGKVEVKNKGMMKMYFIEGFAGSSSQVQKSKMAQADTTKT